MNTNYTMEDIGKFIEDYKEAQGAKPSNWMNAIPFVGRETYERAALEDQKRVVFENAYNKAMTGSIEEQEKFISEIAPVLDDFYSKNKNNRR